MSQVLTSVAAAYLISQGAPWVSRLYLYPGIAFAIAFVDSARQGLCTESLVSAGWNTVYFLSCLGQQAGS